MHATETYDFADDIENEIQKIWQFPMGGSACREFSKPGSTLVFAMGRTYGGDRRYANGAFRSNRAMLSLTTPAPVPSYVKSGINGDIQAILRPVQRGILASICC